MYPTYYLIKYPNKVGMLHVTYTNSRYEAYIQRAPYETVRSYQTM